MKEAKVTLSIKLDKEFHRKVKILAATEGMTIKDMFIECMEKRLAEAKKKETK
jgi:predicted DNA-binding ribbon-helix-helix protein